MLLNSLSRLPKSSVLPVVFCCLTLPVFAENAVDLGLNENFVALAATTLTINGDASTVISGNIGVSPGDAITGVPPVIIDGNIHAGDTVAADAQLDLTVAYNDAAGRSNPTLVAGNIGGQTLTPGLYKSESSLEVSSGDLTLDAQGDPNAVFIFQIGSTLDMTPGRAVNLIGNARAENIFWQVGSSATFGTTSVIHGTIMADISISFNTGARLTGRALARQGAVTLDQPASITINPPDEEMDLADGWVIH